MSKRAVNAVRAAWVAATIALALAWRGEVLRGEGPALSTGRETTVRS